MAQRRRTCTNHVRQGHRCIQCLDTSATEKEAIPHTHNSDSATTEDDFCPPTQTLDTSATEEYTDRHSHSFHSATTEDDSCPPTQILNIITSTEDDTDTRAHNFDSATTEANNRHYGSPCDPTACDEWRSARRTLHAPSRSEQYADIVSHDACPLSAADCETDALQHGVASHAPSTSHVASKIESYHKVARADQSGAQARGEGLEEASHINSVSGQVYRASEVQRCQVSV